MSYENMSTADLVKTWDEASQDLKGCSWHHPSAHRRVEACIRELAARGAITPARGNQSVEID